MNSAQGTGGRLSELSAYDCWGLLESEEIGRVAWGGPDGTAVVPVTYVVAEGGLWFRVNPTSAFARECVGQRVVVEVDHVDRQTRSGWSVVVAGEAELVGREEVSDVLVGLQAWASGERGMFVKIHPDQVTGRRLLPPVSP